MEEQRLRKQKERERQQREEAAEEARLNKERDLILDRQRQELQQDGRGVEERKGRRSVNRSQFQTS